MRPYSPSLSSRSVVSPARAQVSAASAVAASGSPSRDHQLARSAAHLERVLGAVVVETRSARLAPPAGGELGEGDRVDGAGRGELPPRRGRTPGPPRHRAWAAPRSNARRAPRHAALEAPRQLGVDRAGSAAAARACRPLLVERKRRLQTAPPGARRPSLARVLAGRSASTPTSASIGTSTIKTKKRARRPPKLTPRRRIPGTRPREVMTRSRGERHMALGAIAQLEERLDRTQEVAGSSPTSSIWCLSY